MSEERKAISQVLAIQASGVTTNNRPDGVIEIYIKESRYDWKVTRPWAGYEVIEITPKKKTEIVVLPETSKPQEQKGGIDQWLKNKFFALGRVFSLDRKFSD